MKTLFTALCFVAVAMLSAVDEAHASPRATIETVAIEAADHVAGGEKLALALPLDVMRAAPASKASAGDSVYNQLKVSDASGFATTVAAAGTPVAVTHATLITAQGEDGSNCITDTATSGRFTVAACGVGKVLLRVCLNDVTGVNSATWTAGIYRTRAAVVTAQSPIIRETEGAAAARDSEGCAENVVLTAEGDTYDVRVDSGTNADTVTIRQMSFLALKLTGG